ncbi:prephenate dehydrogenase [Fulvivirga sediminis]|uniref:Prephenate dehydrogenase n=1 Tax=Fulvivirga sediminis TaxID=2803949 RepID=A0A937FDS1_9BACT|nr:prephenate dehydrogenase [Fulvivirga sediminis]MBL3658678.1 prephenate dehydrogenase [Fulvivirga sediminis]
MKIALVGVGLIGGSFSLAVKRRRLHVEVIGVDKNSDNIKSALRLGIIDREASLGDAIKQSDVVILAIPVDALTSLLPQVLDMVDDHHLVIDFGSTKGAVCASVVAHPKRKCFVAAHPMAGTEYSGPEAAFSTLFEDKIMILCEEEKSGEKQLNLFQEICKNLAMRVVTMKPEDHDLHIAYVSHLSHISSFALSTTVLAKEKDEKHIFAMAGSGFASTVRLAKSSPAMWSPIFRQNQENLSGALETYIAHLQKFKKALDAQDAEIMVGFMKEANKIRPIIDGIK